MPDGAPKLGHFMAKSLLSGGEEEIGKLENRLFWNSEFFKLTGVKWLNVLF